MAETTKPAAPKEPAAKATPAPASAPAAAAKAAPKKDNTLKIVLIVVGVLFGLGVLGVLLMTIFFAALFHHAASTVKVDKNGNATVNVKSTDGQSSASIGASAKLPAGFPSDVPIYSPSTIVYATKDNQTRYSTAAKTSASVQTVLNYYHTQLTNQGWQNTNESSYGDGTILTYTKDSRSMSVTVNNEPNETTDKTLITIVVEPTAQ